MFFSYDHLKFRYEPFPIGIAKPLMDPAIYKEFVDSYPDKELFAYISKLGKKIRALGTLQSQVIPGVYSNQSSVERTPSMDQKRPVHYRRF